MRLLTVEFTNKCSTTTGAATSSATHAIDRFTPGHGAGPPPPRHQDSRSAAHLHKPTHGPELHCAAAGERRHRGTHRASPSPRARRAPQPRRRGLHVRHARRAPPPRPPWPRILWLCIPIVGSALRRRTRKSSLRRHERRTEGDKLDTNSSTRVFAATYALAGDIHRFSSSLYSDSQNTYMVTNTPPQPQELTHSMDSTEHEHSLALTSPHHALFMDYIFGSGYNSSQGRIHDGYKDPDDVRRANHLAESHGTTPSTFTRTEQQTQHAATRRSE